ncbi:hypothetical protein HKX48_001117 [Thoreauomyces humboldtii]|nr:hypothetical protein HKX48_001117 [Thoreauomyces humboldtii]
MRWGARRSAILVQWLLLGIFVSVVVAAAPAGLRHPPPRQVAHDSASVALAHTPSNPISPLPARATPSASPRDDESHVVPSSAGPTKKPTGRSAVKTASERPTVKTSKVVPTSSPVGRATKAVKTTPASSSQTSEAGPVRAPSSSLSKKAVTERASVPTDSKASTSTASVASNTSKVKATTTVLSSTASALRVEDSISTTVGSTASTSIIRSTDSAVRSTQVSEAAERSTATPLSSSTARFTSSEARISTAIQVAASSTTRAVEATSSASEEIEEESVSAAQTSTASVALSASPSSSTTFRVSVTSASATATESSIAIPSESSLSVLSSETESTKTQSAPVTSTSSARKTSAASTRVAPKKSVTAFLPLPSASFPDPAPLPTVTVTEATASTSTVVTEAPPATSVIEQEATVSQEATSVPLAVVTPSATEAVPEPVVTFAPTQKIVIGLQVPTEVFPTETIGVPAPTKSTVTIQGVTPEQQAAGNAASAPVGTSPAVVAGPVGSTAAVPQAQPAAAGVAAAPAAAAQGSSSGTVSSGTLPNLNPGTGAAENLSASGSSSKAGIYAGASVGVAFVVIGGLVATGYRVHKKRAGPPPLKKIPEDSFSSSTPPRATSGAGPGVFAALQYEARGSDLDVPWILPSEKIPYGSPMGSSPRVKAMENGYDADEMYFGAPPEPVARNLSLYSDPFQGPTEAVVHTANTLELPPPTVLVSANNHEVSHDTRNSFMTESTETTERDSFAFSSLPSLQRGNDDEFPADAVQSSLLAFMNQEPSPLTLARANAARNLVPDNEDREDSASGYSVPQRSDPTPQQTTSSRSPYTFSLGDESTYTREEGDSSVSESDRHLSNTSSGFDGFRASCADTEFAHGAFDTLRTVRDRPDSDESTYPAPADVVQPVQQGRYGFDTLKTGRDGDDSITSVAGAYKAAFRKTFQSASSGESDGQPVLHRFDSFDTSMG